MFRRAFCEVCVPVTIVTSGYTKRNIMTQTQTSPYYLPRTIGIAGAWACPHHSPRDRLLALASKKVPRSSNRKNFVSV